jgi:hypothetical protein
VRTQRHQARWRSNRSKASGRSEAQKFADERGKERGEHKDPILCPTGARVAVWWPNNGGGAAVEEELSGDSTQDRREGEKRGDVCGEDRRRRLAFTCVVG